MTRAHWGARLDELAEHLSNGLTVKQAGERMGIGYRAANAVMQRLRAKMGDQAR